MWHTYSLFRANSLERTVGETGASAARLLGITLDDTVYAEHPRALDADRERPDFKSDSATADKSGPGDGNWLFLLRGHEHIPRMRNGRCRLHGGCSTGPRTPEGRERAKVANWRHGGYSQAAKQERREVRELLHLARELMRNMCLG